MPRVFLSYCSKDKPFARALYERLAADGVDRFFDDESIGWGGNFVRSLERTSALAGDPAGLVRKARPLLLHPCQHLRTFPRFLRPIKALDVSTAEAFEANYPKVCRELGGEPGSGARPARDRGESPRAGGPLPAAFLMPYGSLRDKFVGRNETLWNLHDNLGQHGVTILTGLPGVGKTQTAIEYAHRFSGNYPGGVFWVNADDGLAMLAVRIAGAAGIEIDAKREVSDQIEELWRYLNQRPPVLILLDNFPDSESLRGYLPPISGVRTLVTARRRDLTAYPNLDLDVLTPEQGLALLNTGKRRLGPEALPLVARLGGLPLALELARGFLNARVALRTDELLQAIDEAGEMPILADFTRAYRDELPSGHERDVAATFQLSWDLASEPARRVLRAMSEVAPVPVPGRLLRRILNLPATRATWNDPLENALSEAHLLSLLDLDENGDLIGHRLLLSFVAQTHGDTAVRARTTDAVLGEMSRAGNEHDIASLSELKPLIPHAEWLLRAHSLSPAREIDLTSWLGQHHLDIGQYQLSRNYFAKSLDVATKARPAGHPDIAIRQSNLAVVLHRLGQLEEARNLFRATLASEVRVYRPDHPMIAITKSNLAAVLQELGEVSEAAGLLRDVLESAVRNYRPDHPFVARAQANLAGVLMDLGSTEEAVELMRKAFSSDKRNYPQDHPVVAICQSNFAVALQQDGKIDEALVLLQGVLATLGKTYGPGHPRVVQAQLNLGDVLARSGRREEGCTLLWKALDEAKSFEPPDERLIAIVTACIAFWKCSPTQSIPEVNRA